jgi:hypothetical protein
VKTQIWIAISVYLLVAIVKKRLGLPGSLYTFYKSSQLPYLKNAHFSGTSAKGLKKSANCRL